MVNAKTSQKATTACSPSRTSVPRGFSRVFTRSVSPHVFGPFSSHACLNHGKGTFGDRGVTNVVTTVKKYYSLLGICFYLSHWIPGLRIACNPTATKSHQINVSMCPVHTQDQSLISCSRTNMAAKDAGIKRPAPCNTTAIGQDANPGSRGVPKKPSLDAPSRCVVPEPTRRSTSAFVIPVLPADGPKGRQT